MPPRIFIVAGPPGGGKSTAFPVSEFGVDFFNADDHAAALNHASYLDIPCGIRDQVNCLFGSFITDHIERRVSCAFETTLRSSITFEQAAKARQAGFITEMRYVALEDFGMHLERVKMRADAGGHSAPETLLRAIYESSINNLARAIREIDFIASK
jgi:predicted ABC-type ATPase